ncbi:MAG: hypothetical protein QOH86_1086 [Sphingomonadales bacterium]|jgi:hypothetical protein|nr:hypothetical protein [Sphingomonadales bacterium]
MANEAASVRDVELTIRVLEDITALLSLAQSDPMGALRKSDPWLQLPHPSGNGHLLAGAVSAEALRTLTRRALDLRDLHGQVDFGSAQKVLQNEFVQRFIIENRSPDQKQTARLLSWAAKKLEQTRSTWSYYIPVRFMFTTEPEQIVLGPVVLLSRRRALREVIDGVRGYLKASKTEEDRKWSRRHLLTALRYYSNFKWVAKVHVWNCDERTSKDLSFEVLTSALDCLHLLLGRQHSHRMRVGDYDVRMDKRALGYFDSNNQLHVSTSSGSLDLMGFMEGWSQQLKREDIAEMILLIGLALEARADAAARKPLAGRFLEAARWFGEGVRDKAAFSKVVKFITAVERLVVAGKTEDLTQTVSTRVADLTLESDSADTWERRRQDVVKAYALRSDLVHGSVSPFAERVHYEVSLAGDVAEKTVSSLLFRLGQDGLSATAVSEKEYADWFDRMRPYVTALHARRNERAAQAQLDVAAIEGSPSREADINFSTSVQHWPD